MVFLPVLQRRKKDLLINLHFLSRSPDASSHAFHDRFISNCHFCFAIGHGCDICGSDDHYTESLIPPVDRRVLTDFNVFYGCSKRMHPEELSVFEPVNMYPGFSSFKALTHRDLLQMNRFSLGRLPAGTPINKDVGLSQGGRATLKISLGPIKQEG
jgi:hypothetical protein